MLALIAALALDLSLAMALALTLALAPALALALALATALAPAPTAVIQSSSACDVSKPDSLTPTLTPALPPWEAQPLTPRPSRLRA